jgi:hypothetical protein
MIFLVEQYTGYNVYVNKNGTQALFTRLPCAYRILASALSHLSTTDIQILVYNKEYLT